MRVQANYHESLHPKAHPPSPTQQELSLSLSPRAGALIVLLGGSGIDDPCQLPCFIEVTPTDVQASNTGFAPVTPTNNEPGDEAESSSAASRVVEPSAEGVALHLHALVSAPQSIPTSAACSALLAMDFPTRLALATRLAPPLLNCAPLAAYGHELLCWALQGSLSPKLNTLTSASRSLPGGGAALALQRPTAILEHVELDGSVLANVGESVDALTRLMSSHPEQHEREHAHRTSEQLLSILPPVSRLERIRALIDR